MIDVKQARDEAWKYANQQDIDGFQQLLDFFEDKFAELLLSGNVEGEPSEASSYRYKDFDTYWKIIVPTLWNVKEWDNDKIKAWLEATFENSRQTAD